MFVHFPKSLRLREEDYWIHAVTTLTVIFLAMAFYASTLPFKGPTTVLAAFGLWFSTIKIKKGYGSRRAWIHILLTAAVAGVVALLSHFLTN